MSCSPEPYTRSKNKIKVELNLANYAAKSDFKKPKGADTSNFVKKVDLASLKLDVQKLEIDKLVKLTSNLNNLKRKVDNW